MGPMTPLSLSNQSRGTRFPKDGSMTEFAGIVPAIAEALTKRGYSTLTPVQQAMIDTEMDGRDALVSAQTGSGKTVAFGLAMAPTLLGDAKRFKAAGLPLAVVVAPTRELAMQVKRELEWLYEMTGAVIASCVGGMDIRSERRALERGAHIVVGTPAGSATTSAAARSTCRRRAPSCSMRPTRCSTSASAKTWSSSSRPHPTIVAR